MIFLPRLVYSLSNASRQAMSGAKLPNARLRAGCLVSDKRFWMLPFFFLDSIVPLAPQAKSAWAVHAEHHPVDFDHKQRKNRAAAKKRRTLSV